MKTSSLPDAGNLRRRWFPKTKRIAALVGAVNET
jgi:hypothetical protein